MRCVVVGKVVVRAINEMNATQKHKTINVITLVDGRQVVNADILGDPYWSSYRATINKIPVVEIDDSLFPQNRFPILCARDSRSIVTPEDGAYWWNYYVSRGELPA